MQPSRAMRYHALAADYDGTLAHHGRIEADTWAALRKLRDSGRKLVMVTGRELDELLALLEHPELFDRIVAENGALVYEPATKEIRITCAPPDEAFVAALTARGVDRVAVGRAIVATWEPHETVVLDVIRELGLGLQVIFNKGAVMVLPSGVNKASGLSAALLELGMSPHNVVGIGDAENDHSLLELCECGVAVSNALPSLQERADLVTRGDHGRGVIELATSLLENDLAGVGLARRRVLIGRAGDDAVTFDPYRANLMVCGTSGSGKSTLTTGILERLSAAHYQFAIVDPEGDYTELDFAVALGATNRAPLVSEVLEVLDAPATNVAVNLLGIAVDHRPEFFTQLIPALNDLRARTGRPHWLVIDEAHHLLPTAWAAAEFALRPRGSLYVTVHPASVAPPVIASITAVLGVGDNPDATIREFCEAAGCAPPPPAANDDKLPAGHAVFWRVGDPQAVVVVTEPPKSERKRHSRKYMEGNLGSSRAFYFRGAEGKLKLKAHNLQLFVHLADGVDDDTWTFHLGRGDYSNWLRIEVKDPGLADIVAQVEADGALDAAASRAAIRAAIEQRYTLPADQASGLVDEEG